MTKLVADRVLVTGASGFVGSAVVRALLTAGFAVRAFVRPTTAKANLFGLPIEIAEGDLLNKASIEAALKDTRFLIHVAADYRLWTRNPSRLIENNVTGTKNVMEAALAGKVEKAVYTSSVCTLTNGPGYHIADEQFSLEPSDACNPYKRSKVLAEQVVLDFVKTHGLNVVVVNPSTPVGPRDLKPTPTGRIIVECAAGNMPAYVDTGLNVVHVDDVAQGHVAALCQGATGERYVLGGENVVLRDMLNQIAQISGRKPPWMKLSIPVVYPFAVASEGLAWITGRPPFATVDSLRMARRPMWFNDTKARRELGYTSKPYEEGLASAVTWFKNAGMLPAG